MKRLTTEVVSNKTTKTNKSYVAVKDTDGNWYNIWDGSIKMEVGKVYEVEIEERGDFKTITSAKEVEPQSGDKTAQSKDDIWVKKDQMNARQSGLKAAAPIVAAQIEQGEKISDPMKETLRIAKEFARWVYYGDKKLEYENTVEDVPFQDSEIGIDDIPF